MFWEEFFVPPTPALVFATTLCVALVALAFRHHGRLRAAPAIDGPSPRRLGPIAFVCTAIHFVGVYAVVVGLLGRYDLTIGGLLAAVFVWWLTRPARDFESEPGVPGVH